MKNSARLIPAGFKSKLQTSRKLIIPILLTLSFLSANALALGRNNAPCSFGDDCAATIYYHICNNWCFWY